MKNYLILVLLLFSVDSHAALNKWVDASGKVHYSDEPPPANAKVETIHVSADTGGTSSASATSATKSIAEQELELKKTKQAREDKEKEAEKLKEAARTKLHNCDLARDNLRVLTDSPRIATYGDNGERSYMDDATRQQRLEEGRKLVDQYCN